ncbi:MAG: hypothetical protein F6K54_11145 [Okeania sp. SIO3B5]|uniref:hypothetical protein n=1 Tax=Okeania sp. SIO3B5 TaxID=2607811 RepID=UPI0013FFD1E5|nr:hypothetical protein [Okeania sp. SIO3B5]NEO53587.1 hypothetical protein [Okeania sp. SIO3B5]
MESAVSNKELGFAEKVLWVRVGNRRQPTPNPSDGGQGCFILDRHGDTPDTPDTGIEAFKRR